jgi:hypothetical protein
MNAHQRRIGNAASGQQLAQLPGHRFNQEFGVAHDFLWARLRCWLNQLSRMTAAAWASSVGSPFSAATAGSKLALFGFPGRQPFVNRRHRQTEPPLQLTAEAQRGFGDGVGVSSA